MCKPHSMVIFSAVLVGFSVIWTLFQVPEAGARDWIVPAEAPTIAAAMDSCVIGDVVVLQPGTYTDCTAFSNGVYHIAVLPEGVSVRGATGDPADVILDAGYVGRCFEVRNNTEDFSIENITMRRGRAVSPLGKGGAVFGMFSNMTFRNCVFDSNYADFGGGAISAGYGELTLEDCLFTGNETDGIGAAIQVSNTPTAISGSTIWGCRGSGIHYAVGEFSLSHCIIADGDAEALVQNSGSDPDPVLNCNVIHGNETDYGEFFEDLLGLDGNISEDPLFCNVLSGDFTVYAVSPCNPENSGDCGQIGFYGVGCGAGAAVYVIQPDGSGSLPTIQAAIDVSATGDTIALADGVFTGEGNRDIDFLGKDITVLGLNGNPETAVIDCEGTAADPHRAFIFQNGENVTSVVQDIGIINGNVTTDGGGIWCSSSPTIRNVRLAQNHADRGGAMFCNGGSPVVENCTIVQNEGRVRAGGIGFLGGAAEVRNCFVSSNWGYMGGAFFLPDSAEVTISGCTVIDNNNSLDRATIGLDGNSVLTIQNCIITGGPYHAFGEYEEGGITISGCDVYGNGSDYSGPIAGQNGNSGNISADPLFCDPGAGDYTLRADSPCSEYSAPNREQIGNQPVGCAAPTLFADLSANLPAAAFISVGVSVADWNDDGHPDVLFMNRDGTNEIYDGAGDFNFIVHSPDLLVWPHVLRGASFTDWDADGDLDVYLDLDDVTNVLGVNEGGIFTATAVDSLAMMGPASSSRWGDHNGDGHPDIFVAGPDSNSVLMTSDGEGDYTNNTSGPLANTGPVVSAAFADYDNDGDQDLYVVQHGRENLLLEWDGEWILNEEEDLAHAGAGRGVTWADFDNDGDLDLYHTVAGEANELFENLGNNHFTRLAGAGPAGDEGPGRSGIWGDWDNDGDLDLFISNCGRPDRLLRNQGGYFTDTRDSNFAQPDSTEGAAFADIDGDGDLDILCAVRGAGNRLLRNDVANGNHWLKVDLRSLQGRSMSAGARVSLYTGQDSLQIREISTGGGWQSQDDPMVHFGLGTHDVVDSLVITWPGGTPLTMTQVAVDQILVLTELEPSTSPVSRPELRPFRLEAAYPNPFNPATTIVFEVPTQEHVCLEVYDVAGRRVRSLVNEVKSVGRHEVVWRGRDEKGRKVAAGVYFTRLQAGRFVANRTVTLVK